MDTSSVPVHRRVVIVGGGFGGLAAARALRTAPVDIVLLDRTNHHLFQPLLYQVATAGLSPGDIAVPLRHILARQHNVTVLCAEVRGIDTAGRTVLTDDDAIPYDWLILATGATHSYFGHPEWERHAPGLKTVTDATRIRALVLRAFEKAELLEQGAERTAQLTFVLVGAGPTGVEMAGAIAELAHTALRGEFRRIRPEEARILLVEAGPRLLSAMPAPLGEAAHRRLERMGVSVLVNCRVSDVQDGCVTAGGERIESETVVWTAGVRASPVGGWLGVATDAAGRVRVSPDLSVEGKPGVYVVGDAAAVDNGGATVPGVAPAAIQEGAYAARAIAAAARGGPAPPPFQYRDKGALATVGRRFAVAQIAGIRLSGALAWLIWSFVHIMTLVGFRNRLSVMLQWAWAYVTFDRGVRILSPDDQPTEANADGGRDGG